MSWLKKKKTGITTQDKKEVPERPVHQVRRLRRDPLPARARGRAVDLPEVRAPLPHRLEGLRRPARRSRLVRGALHRPRGRATRSSSATHACATPSATRSAQQGDRPQRRRAHRPGDDRRHAGRARGHGLLLHGRHDGLGGGREDRAHDRAGASPSAARSSSSPPPAARACRRASSRSCRWRRPRRCWRTLKEARLPFLSILTDPVDGRRAWPRTRRSATSSWPSPAR